MFLFISHYRSNNTLNIQRSLEKNCPYSDGQKEPSPSSRHVSVIPVPLGVCVCLDLKQGDLTVIMPRGYTHTVRFSSLFPTHNQTGLLEAARQLKRPTSTCVEMPRLTRPLLLTTSFVSRGFAIAACTAGRSWTPTFARNRVFSWADVPGMEL